MRRRKVLIIGGAGFIGCNIAKAFCEIDDKVVVFDNLSRRGTVHNLAWLQEKNYVSDFHKGDIRNLADLEQVFTIHSDVEVVIHLAAQTAVTTSVRDPREDFEINALGTFNVLEAARRLSPPPVILYASTNKVYGGMENIKIVEEETRYRYQDFPDGIPETQTLDFHSPYGCSKGAADQYVRDYTRIYKVPTVVFRQSCIYGYHQFGIEDQGWVAWFTVAALSGRKVTIYGDGKQVRDVLFIDDLVQAYKSALEHIEVTAGKVYNIGGGPNQSISIWREFQPLLEDLVGRSIAVERKDWRPGDQPVFIADIRRAREDFGWEPQIGIAEGVSYLFYWIRDNLDLFR